MSFLCTLLKGAQSHPNWLKKWSHLSLEIAADSYFLNYFLYFSCQIQIEIRWLVLRLQGYFLNFLRCNGTLRISLWLLSGKLWQFQSPGTPWFPSEISEIYRVCQIRFSNFKITFAHIIWRSNWLAAKILSWDFNQEVGIKSYLYVFWVFVWK